MTPLFLALGLLACTEKDPEDSGDNDDGSYETAEGGCQELARVELADLSEPAEGFDWAPAALLEGAAGSFEGTADHATTGEDYLASGSFTLDAPVYAVDSEPTPSDYTTEEDTSWYECPDYYETEVLLSLSLGEDLVAVAEAGATLFLWSAEQGSFTFDLAEDQIDPALVPDEVDLSEWDSHAFDLRGELSPPGWSGSVGFFAERSDDEVAEAMGTEVLFWDLGGGGTGVAD